MKITETYNTYFSVRTAQKLAAVAQVLADAKTIEDENLPPREKLAKLFEMQNNRRISQGIGDDKSKINIDINCSWTELWSLAQTVDSGIGECAKLILENKLVVSSTDEDNVDSSEFELGNKVFDVSIAKATRTICAETGWGLDDVKHRLVNRLSTYITATTSLASMVSYLREITANEFSTCTSCGYEDNTDDIDWEYCRSCKAFRED